MILLKILLEFGLVVFIWMIQLVVYPSLLYFNREELIRWYQEGNVYLSYIGMVLAPTQMFLSAILIFTEPGVYSISTFLIITSLWIYSFTGFMKLHNSIMSGENTSLGHRRLMLRRNWIRVAGISLVFIWGLIYISREAEQVALLTPW